MNFVETDVCVDASAQMSFEVSTAQNQISAHFIHVLHSLAAVTWTMAMNVSVNDGRLSFSHLL